MAECCTSVWPYFHELHARESIAQECNIQPYCILGRHKLYTTLVLVAPRRFAMQRMSWTTKQELASTAVLLAV